MLWIWNKFCPDNVPSLFIDCAQQRKNWQDTGHLTSILSECFWPQLFQTNWNSRRINEFSDNLTSLSIFTLGNGLDKNDSTERQRTCWNAKKVLAFLLSVLTSDWLQQQKLSKLHKAVYIYSSLLSNHLPYSKIWSQFE